MSTSISLTISGAEQDDNKQTSKSNCDLFDRRHTGLGLGASQEQALQFEHRAAAGKLKRWRHHDNRTRNPRDGPQSLRHSQDDLLRANSRLVAPSSIDDFYAEVDDRMSRNSLEYPAQQAKYIDRWLNEASSAARSKSFDETPRTSRRGLDEMQDAGELRGNVIGIRGFSSESFIAESKRCREDYARLKQDYLRLQVEHKRLRARLAERSRQEDACEHWTHKRRGPSNDLDALRALVIKQGRKLDEMDATSGRQQKRLCDRCESRAPREEAHQSALIALEELKRDCERSKQTIDERDKEVRQLRGQLAGLQLEPANRKLLALSNENARLKSAGASDRAELEALKGGYVELEAKLRLLMDSQRALSQEQSDETKKNLLELCRLQVNQPKLEMLLATERQIREQLQTRVDALSDEKQAMQEQLEALEHELNDAKLRTRAHQSNDLAKCRAELLAWQDKYHKLEKERATLEEFLRASRAKVAQLDAKLQLEIQQVRDLGARDLDQAQAQLRRRESDCNALKGELARLSTKLEQCDSDRGQSREQVLELHRRLELAESALPNERAHKEATLRRLEESELELAKACQQLTRAEVSKTELETKLEMAQAELEQTRRQLADSKRRFDLQQKSLDESSARKERELAKLRVDLNFERYNRQVSLRGIERELRSSLRELEAMKYRFSKRLSGGGGGGESDVRNAQASVQSQRAGAPCCAPSADNQAEQRPPSRAGPAEKRDATDGQDCRSVAETAGVERRCAKADPRARSRGLPR